MGMRVPPLIIKVTLESNPPKSRILLRGLAASLTAHRRLPLTGARLQLVGLPQTLGNPESQYGDWPCLGGPWTRQASVKDSTRQQHMSISLSLSICVNIYIYIYIYIHVCLSLPLSLYIYIHMSYMHTSLSLSLYIYICMYTYIYIYIYICIHIHIHICICILYIIRDRRPPPRPPPPRTCRRACRAGR